MEGNELTIDDFMFFNRFPFFIQSEITVYDRDDRFYCFDNISLVKGKEKERPLIHAFCLYIHTQCSAEMRKVFPPVITAMVICREYYNLRRYLKYKGATFCTLLLIMTTFHQFKVCKHPIRCGSVLFVTTSFHTLKLHFATT